MLVTAIALLQLIMHLALSAILHLIAGAMCLCLVTLFPPKLCHASVMAILQQQVQSLERKQTCVKASAIGWEIELEMHDST